MITVEHGDCVEVLATLEANSVDAVITDPPYGIGFMRRQWDTFSPERVGALETRRERKVPAARASARWPGKAGTRSQGGGVAVQYDESQSGNARFQEWCMNWASECLRVLKPGGHLLAFGGPRTEHRLACGIEDAGFVIRDKLLWLFGSGYAKSRNLCRCAQPEASGQAKHGWDVCAGCGGLIGLGTGLKPGWEPIVLARKRLSGTVGENVEAYGTGALNIAGCRLVGVGLERWPSNVALDEIAAAALDDEVGPRRSGANPTRRGAAKHGQVYGAFAGDVVIESARAGDVGGPSRFFYCPKVSSAERNAGLEEIPGVQVSDGRQAPADSPYLRAETRRRNHHPTVKPVALMRWLVRLVTPPAGLVVDPFAGSGTTGVACVLEGRSALLIEREAEYLPIIAGRVRHAEGPLFASAGGE
ncbi:MAG: site-specific DNA-methyltransferase [Thermomicrobiales bacterium]|nr:site-specific DNA-methyltransferase [Thermomicrobiales bacterium]